MGRTRARRPGRGGDGVNALEGRGQDMFALMGNVHMYPIAQNTCSGAPMDIDPELVGGGAAGT